MSSGISELSVLLKQLQPKLNKSSWVFCTVQGKLADYVRLEPLASVQEPEGLTLVLTKIMAEQANFSFDGVFKQITLQVHSSLSAVGLTAAVSSTLAQHGISANVIAGFYHDHIFVPEQQASEAIALLQQLSL